MNAFQNPVAASTTEGLVATLQSLGWVDKTALGVLLVFFVLGLFKGLIWQVSRIGILVAAYFVAGRFGRDVAVMLGASESSAANAQSATSGTAASGAGSLGSGAAEASIVPQGETTLYVAYCLLFVAVLIVLSLLAMLIKKLADRAGLGFFDRLGGGVLGVATGACVVLAGLFGINMFFPSSQLAEAATDSHCLRFSQRAISWLGEAVDDDLRSVLALRPLGRAVNSNPDAPPTGVPFEGGVPIERGEPRMPTPLPLPEGMRIESGNTAPNGGIPSPSPSSPPTSTDPGGSQPLPQDPGKGRGGIR